MDTMNKTPDQVYGGTVPPVVDRDVLGHGNPSPYVANRKARRDISHLNKSRRRTVRRERLRSLLCSPYPVPLWRDRP